MMAQILFLNPEFDIRDLGKLNKNNFTNKHSHRQNAYFLEIILKLRGFTYYEPHIFDDLM